MFCDSLDRFELNQPRAMPFGDGTVKLNFVLEFPASTILITDIAFNKPYAESKNPAINEKSSHGGSAHHKLDSDWIQAHVIIYPP